MESNPKTAYRQLYDQCTAPVLYNAPWWLDATCGPEGWSAWIGYNDAGLPVSAFPYALTRIRGLAALITPPFSQWVAWMHHPKHEPLLPDPLYDQLPDTAILDLSLKPDERMSAALQHTGVVLRYSYILAAHQCADPQRASYNEGLKRNIRQARQDYQTESTSDVEAFLRLCRLSYKAQNHMPPPWLEQVVPAVVRELISRNSGQITFAKTDGHAIAGILTGWDQGTAYYLAGGRIAGDQGASAHALLLDQAVQMAGQKNLAFDFEGSMHPGIANFFQSFGATPTAYWNLRRYRRLGRLWAILK